MTTSMRAFAIRKGVDGGHDLRRAAN